MAAVLCIVARNKDGSFSRMPSVSLVCAMLISVTDCYNILALLPYPGKSHQMVFEPILDELITRGHNLTVVSFFPLEVPLVNRRDVSLAGLAPLNVEHVDLNAYDYSPYVGKTVFKVLNQFAIVKNLPEDSVKLCGKILEFDNFQEFVKGEGDYDLILVEHYNSDCMLGIVHNYGLPSVGLMSCSLMPWTPSWIGGDDNPAIFPSMLQPFTDEMSFFERIENVFDLIINKVWHNYVSVNEKEILENKLQRILPPLEDVGKNISVILINTYYALNGVRVTPPSLIEIGGIHLHKRFVAPLPLDLEKWVAEAEHGVIIFSLGSFVRNSSLPSRLFATVLKVFKHLPQRIVWKWETEVHPNLPENVRLMKWLPQNDLLRHPNCMAFITHGGLLSLTEAVAAGIPMLIIPILGDQPGNAAYAKRAGIAEVLHLNDITEEKLFMAMLKVLSSEKRSHSQKFKIFWFDRPVTPIDTAIYYIEKTARYGNLNMSSNARFLSNPQLVFFNSIPYIIIISLFFGILSCCLYYLSFTLRNWHFRYSTGNDDFLK